MAFSLDPISIVALAEHLRDETWLDVRVCDLHSPLERVRIEEIVIRRDIDNVVFVQEIMGGEEVTLTRHVVDGESIMYANPTVFALEDVQPPKAPRVKLQPSEKFGKGLEPDEFSILVRVVRAMEHYTSLRDSSQVLELLRDTPERAAVWVRHWALWGLYELTDLSPVRCCVALGYASPQPWYSTQVDWRQDEASAVKMRMLREYVKQELGLAVAPRPHSL